MTEKRFQVWEQEPTNKTTKSEVNVITKNKRFYVDKSPITHLYVPYDKEHEFVFEGVENGSTIMKLVGLLNNASEETEQLKSEMNDLLKENISYKNAYLAYKDDWEYEKKWKEKYKEENEQLKKELKDYHNAFDCNQCEYHNYDWFDDGDEFEVCDKGNHEELMYNHSCKDWEEL